MKFHIHSFNHRSGVGNRSICNCLVGWLGAIGHYYFVVVSTLMKLLEDDE